MPAVVLVYHSFLMFQRHPIQSNLPMFITTNLRGKKQLFADPAAARIAVEVLYSKQEMRPFDIFGFVIMPDHCHFLLRVPEGGSISKIMNVYKRGVSFAIGQGPIWQSRFHIKIPDDIKQILHYIHRNPVKEGICDEPEEYPWSSASGKWDVLQLDCMGVVA